MSHSGSKTPSRSQTSILHVNVGPEKLNAFNKVVAKDDERQQ